MKSTFLMAGALVGAMAVGWGGARYFRSTQVAGDAGHAHVEEELTLRLLANPVPLRAFTAQDLDGRPISSESWRGKVTIVNFWATWCPPCRAEIPDLIALQNEYPDQLQIVGISQDEAGPDVVRRFVEEQGINYPIVMSTPELEAVFTGIYALPTSFIVDRDLQIVQKHVGLLNPAVTEGETRLLAGLSVDAKVEYVEDETKALIRNAAQATKIPGVDLDRLAPEARTAVLTQLNAESCTCGCGLTLAACRINDPSCSISLPLAQKIAAAAQP
ncbi:MAG TPA: TlpA disulfide reductase family protein [Vicinamibacterales bacterium]|nr:TlpA disulfide reductase family protein [Vicinamibacterales bacterium]